VISCGDASLCPAGLTCVPGPYGSVCASHGNTCGAQEGGIEIGRDVADGGDGADRGVDADAPVDVMDGPLGADLRDAPDGEAGTDAVVVEDAFDARDTGDAPDLADASDLGDVPGGPDGGDAPEGGDRPDGGDGPTGSCGRTSPPTTVCWGGRCLNLSQAVRNNLALWLDPSNLGPPGSKVDTWCDQSGHVNDAYALFELPTVTADGIELAYGTTGAGLAIGNDPSIDFGASDFLVLIVVGITQGSEGRTIFLKSDGATMFPKQVGLEWLVSGSDGLRLMGEVNETTAVSPVATDPGPVRLYGLRRVNDQVELRINGVIVKTTPLATPGASTENGRDVFIGESGSGDPFSVNTLHAVVVIRGALDSTEVGTLEGYLLGAFGL
jgi:hypothetical protein